MCARGKAQCISLWLNLFEWAESFLRNPADSCRGFSRWKTCPMGRIAVRGRQQDRCASPFNPNHFPVVKGWRLASVRSASGRLYPREAASDSRREKVLRTRVRARWNYVGMEPCPASSWEVTNCWEAKCSTADAWRAALHVRGSARTLMLEGKAGLNSLVRCRIGAIAGSVSLTRKAQVPPVYLRKHGTTQTLRPYLTPSAAVQEQAALPDAAAPRAGSLAALAELPVAR